MREETGDIWEAYNAGLWIVIPTNGFVKLDGNAVMGRGLAWQAKERFPCLQLDLGERLKEYGNHVFVFSRYRIITFPVKHKWMEDADLNLIQRSCMELRKLVEDGYIRSLPIYLPRVGCGNGKLDWKDVKPILEATLDNRFIVISLENQV
jgi:hypothetical protein